MPTEYVSEERKRRKEAADVLARKCNVQPSIADYWLWMRWMITVGLWDCYHVGSGRAILQEHLPCKLP